MPVARITTSGTYNSSGSANAGGALSFGQYNDTYPAWNLGQIAGIRSGDGWSGDLLFYTNSGSSQTNITEKARLDSSGKLGIGTTSIDEMLHVEKSVGTTIVKTEVAANSTVGFEIKKTNATTSNWRIVDGQTINGKLEIYDVTNSRNVMTFDQSGKVGMGTISPAPDYGSDIVLEIKGATSPGLVINDTGQGSKYGIHADSNDLKITYGSGALATFQNDGKVGIGESVPLGKLHVKTADSGATADGSADELVIEGSGNTGMSILSGASSSGSIYFGDSGTNWDGYIAYSQANRAMTLGTAAGAGSVTINSTGNVGIGTNSLDISGNGSSYVGLSIIKTSGGDRSAFIELGDNQNADTGHIGNINFVGHYQNAGHKVMGQIGAAASGSTSGQRGSYLHFKTKDNGSSTLSERMRIDSSGNVGIAKTSLATWSSGYNALQVGGRGFVGAHTGSDLYLGQNASFNSGWKYEQSVPASMTQHSGGKITHFVAPAGTAGNAISWNTAMDITAEGTTTLAGSYSATNSVNYVLRLQSSSSGTAVAGHGTGIQFLGERNDGNAQSLALIQAVTSTNSGTSIAADLSFSTGSGGAPSERLRINSSGRQIYNGSSTANGHANFVGEVGSSSKAIMFEHTNGGGECGKIITTSNTAVLSNTSDYRLKENVNYTWDATTRLKQLKPARFNWINDETNTLVDGFLAHEVSSIVPSAVYGEKDGVDEHGNPDWQGIAVTELVPLLVKTIQELEARITELEA